MVPDSFAGNSITRDCAVCNTLDDSAPNIGNVHWPAFVCFQQPDDFLRHTGSFFRSLRESGFPVCSQMMNDRRSSAVLDCPHREACGACSFLGRDYESQLRLKQEGLEDALREGKVPRGSAEILPTLPSPRIEGYRNRAKMSISSSRGAGVSLGYFQRRSREVVDAKSCPVLVPELLETTRRLRKLLNTSTAFPFELRHIDLRCGSDPEVQHLTLVLRSEKMLRLPVEAISKSCPSVAGIAVNLNPKGGAQVIKGKIEPLAGLREVFVEVDDIRLRVSPGSFFQVNLSLLPEIHRLMAEFLGSGSLLIDLYAGVGTHGFAMRKLFGRVLCVEGVRASVADARATIRADGLESVEILASPVLRSLKRLKSEKPSAVILNPSRAGADSAALDAISASTARRVAYLSCEPTTLARDLVRLLAGGFKLKTIRAVDMMPQTRQVEALAFLER